MDFNSWEMNISRSFVAIVFFLCAALSTFGQSSGSITVGGDINTFYPVAWLDGNYTANRSTKLQVGRSNVHQDTRWRGSLVAEITYQTTNWGSAASFIDVDLSTNMVSAAVYKSFIAGWQDATTGNSDRMIVIWLRGGGTTYYYAADAPVNPKVYDGTQNALPYVSSNGSLTLNAKTVVDSYVNAIGKHMQRPLRVYTTLSNYFAGNVGIGKVNPTDRLEVNGTIRAKEIKVETANWPDYVFAEDYELPSLDFIRAYIAEHGHLPEMPSAAEVGREGIALGEINALLLKKIEELTLLLMEKDDQLKKQGDAIDKLSSEMEIVRRILNNDNTDNKPQ
ncbi:hypothetical protein [Sphingobacterium haloxyli]|uniref:Peptidase S74 domain-containing protein n=1 Tax=Sphingobacterium haloxyli TaxID=2100533 RepID=A0A2S9IVI7_9SPHI|nr:hypothetical protein [Sphingobacterium haloxyli]PRD44535.1 hypothetical protein C5745_19345 [Sphingobacterium haloxyli]